MRHHPFKTRVSVGFLLIVSLYLSQDKTAACPSRCACENTYVSCQARNLDEVPLPMPFYAVKIWMYNNDIRSIKNAFKDLKSLTTLSLNGNQITDVSDAFTGSTALTYIYLSDNQISIVKDAFSGLINLYHLNLKNNQITDVTDAFAGLTKLTYLYLQNNRISVVSGAFVGLRALQSLNLQNNNLMALAGAFSGTVLYTLNLHDNPLVCSCSLQEQIEYPKLEFSGLLYLYGSCKLQDNHVFDLTHVRSKKSPFNKCYETTTQVQTTTMTTPTTTTTTTTTPTTTTTSSDDIEPCLDDPCVNGVCSNTALGFSCTCDAGWAGDRCQHDIDECWENPCVRGKCSNAKGGFSCICAAGWTGELCDLETFNSTAKPTTHDSTTKATSRHSTMESTTQVSTTKPTTKDSTTKPTTELSSVDPAALADEDQSAMPMNIGIGAGAGVVFLLVVVGIVVKVKRMASRKSNRHTERSQKGMTFQINPRSPTVTSRDSEWNAKEKDNDTQYGKSKQITNPTGYEGLSGPNDDISSHIYAELDVTEAFGKDKISQWKRAKIEEERHPGKGSVNRGRLSKEATWEGNWNREPYESSDGNFRRRGSYDSIGEVDSDKSSWSHWEDVLNAKLEDDVKVDTKEMDSDRDNWTFQSNRNRYPYDYDRRSYHREPYEPHYESNLGYLP